MAVQYLTGRLHAHGFTNNRWQAFLTEQQTLDDAMQNTFWRHVADTVMGHDRASPKGFMDIIELRKPDTSDYWELLVVGAGQGYINVRLIKDCSAAPVVVPEGPLTVRWNGKVHQVIRTEDSQLMASGFQTLHAAVAWMTDHMRKMAA